MRYSRTQYYNILSYLKKLERVIQTLLENFLHMFIQKVLSCWDRVHMMDWTEQKGVKQNPRAEMEEILLRIQQYIKVTHLNVIFCESYYANHVGNRVN